MRRKILSVVVFVLVTGAFAQGAITAQYQVHHTPLLTVVGSLLGLAIALMLARGIAHPATA